MDSRDAHDGMQALWLERSAAPAVVLPAALHWPAVAPHLVNLEMPNSLTSILASCTPIKDYSRRAGSAGGQAGACPVAGACSSRPDRPCRARHCAHAQQNNCLILQGVLAYSNPLFFCASHHRDCVILRRQIYDSALTNLKSTTSVPGAAGGAWPGGDRVSAGRVVGALTARLLTFGS